MIKWTEDDVIKAFVEAMNPPKKRPMPTGTLQQLIARAQATQGAKIATPKPGAQV